LPCQSGQATTGAATTAAAKARAEKVLVNIMELLSNDADRTGPIMPVSGGENLTAEVPPSQSQFAVIG
jgi:hypothetical protein